MTSLGAVVRPGPAEVAAESDVVITILPADRELKEVAAAVFSGLKRGKALIDMTTASAAALLELEPAARQAGCRLLDAPVSGGVSGAVNGTLTIMVGGEEDLLEEWRPLLSSMGNRIVPVGGLGQGKVVKMVNQALAAVHLVALGEAFALGVRCGASPEMLYDVIRTSSGYSKMMDLRLPGFLLDGTFDPGFRLDLMKKDVRIALDSAQAMGVSMGLASTVDQVFEACCTDGKSDRDYSIAAQFVAGLNGVSLSSSGTPPRT